MYIPVNPKHIHSCHKVNGVRSLKSINSYYIMCITTSSCTWLHASNTSTQTLIVSAISESYRLPYGYSLMAMMVPLESIKYRANRGCHCNGCLALTHWPLGDLNEIFSGLRWLPLYLPGYRSTLDQVKSLVPPGTKPLPEPMLTQVYAPNGVTILSHNELKVYHYPHAAQKVAETLTTMQVGRSWDNCASCPWDLA